MKAAIKAGKLANGFERGKGTVVHAIESDLPYSVCGTRPANQWIQRDDLVVNCKRCLKKLNKDRGNHG